ncbi:VWFC domain-containing protein [Caerostris extrusa]|uniref:VWFC domain-containing protein n=1 Tax=Caerostris extrusa TaxID=172846 RepID=A0AAV4V769_CAEEX|nr:VWFC domain-containing protein [Caerostris extrusa]
MGRTTKIVPATSSKESINETFISETPAEFGDASKEIITADIHQTMFTTIPIEISTEGFPTSTVTSKDLTTESSSETVAFEVTEGSSTKTDLEEARGEDSRITKVTTQEQEISTPSKEELSTLTTLEIVELTTPEKVTESKFITSSKGQELFEKSSTTPHKTEVTDVATETSEMISVKSTETSLEGELTTLLPSTATSFITEKAFKETHLDQEITPAQEEGVLSTYKTTATQPTLEADATTIAEEITLSTEASKSYSVENITAEISTSSESLPDKTTISSKDATEKTTESAGTHITEEFDDRKQFSTILETSTSFEPSSTTKTLEVSTIISTDSDEITPKETVKPTEISKSITESTVSTTEATVEFRATSTPFGKEETVSVTEIQEGEEEKSSESSSIPEELITSSLRANITSEPPSPVTESTSSTATTTLEAITEVSKHLPGETMITKEEEVTPTTIQPGETESSITEKYDCFINETLYADGESIWTIEPCDKCHCFRGEMTCFKIICEVPKRGCTPDTVSEDKCCPTSYKCRNNRRRIDRNCTDNRVAKNNRKDLSTPIPISFMFSTTPSSISTTLITSKPDDVKGDEEDISTDKFIPVTETEKASPSTVKITEDTSSERQTTSAPQLDVKEQTTRVEEKITEISETISSTETTAAVPESITSKSSLTPEIAFDEKAPTTSKVGPTVTVEEHISAEVTTYATSDREERFETTVVVDTKSPEEKITESELTTERTPLPSSTKEDAVSTTTPENKLESTSQTTVSSTSLIKGIEEVTLGTSELTTEKPSFDATTELADTTLSAKKVSATEDRISTAGMISSESSEPSTFKIETDYVTTQKSETDGETKSKPAFTIAQSSSVSSEPTSIVGDRSTESTVTIESKITTEDLLSDITGTTVVQDQFTDSTTTGFTEEVFTEEKSGSSTEAESSTEFSETDKVTKTSAQTEETELKTLPSLAKSSSFETTTLTSSEIGSTTEAESSSVELSSEIKFEDAEKTKNLWQLLQSKSYKDTETTVRVESEIKDLLSKVTTESVKGIEDVITTLLAEKTSTVEPTENITLITEGIEIELSTQEADVTMISLGETKSEPSFEFKRYTFFNSFF